MNSFTFSITAEDSQKDSCFLCVVADTNTAAKMDNPDYKMDEGGLNMLDIHSFVFLFQKIPGSEPNARN